MTESQKRRVKRRKHLQRQPREQSHVVWRRGVSARVKRFASSFDTESVDPSTGRTKLT